MRGFHLECRLAFIHHRETNSPKSLKGSKQLLPTKGVPPQRPVICTSGRVPNAKLNTGSSIYSFKINIEIQSSRSSPGTQNWKTQALQVLVRSVLHELELQDVGVRKVPDIRLGMPSQAPKTSRQPSSCAFKLPNFQAVCPCL